MNIWHKIFNHSAKSNIAAPTAWINDLLSMDDISAIEYSTKKLSFDFEYHVLHNTLLNNTQNTEALLSIDEKTHNIVERITQQFVHIEYINKDLKMRISNAAFLYHSQLFLTYYELSKNYAHPQQRTLHIILSRALSNATQMIKWHYYDDHNEPANFWSKISSVFKTAEELFLLNAKIQSYSDQEPISLSSAYIQACMLGSLQNTIFKPQQIEIVSRLLTAWTSKISIDTKYDAEQHLFYVDTAANSPVRRIRNLKTADSHRYWRFEDVNSKIELGIFNILHNISPSPLMMKEWVTSKYALETLATLRAEWSLTHYKRDHHADYQFNITTF